MKKRNRYAIVFVCCLLSMPTCSILLSGFHAESMGAAFAAGALLGAAHLAIRPIIRFVSRPLGCLTLGLIQPLLDMGLLYLCVSLVDGFAITSKFHALLAVMLINAVCYVAAGRK